MLEVRSLDSISREHLVEVFGEAFSDYATKFSRSQIEAILSRRGFRSAYSFGLFEGERLVSFVCNGIRRVDGRLTAYDSGTGTIAGYRRRGLTKHLLTETVERLRALGVEGYLLEVLTDNAPAIALYDSMGFETMRRFICYAGPTADVRLSAHPAEGVTVSRLPAGEIGEGYLAFCDAEPSWQNSPESIAAGGDSIAAFKAELCGETVGYIAGDPEQGDIMALAVRGDARSRGIGSALLSRFVGICIAGRVKMLNVDHRCRSMIEFLAGINIPVSVNQYEMYRRL